MKFEGIIPAIVTPYDANGDVNHDVMDKLVDRLIENDVGGLFVCGSTGEWWALLAEERMAIAERVVARAGGRVKVMVHIGANSTRLATQLARHAEKIGADAISSLPPAGYRFSTDALWNHFRSIGASCSLPLYLYHLPQVHGDQITLDKLVEATDSIPTLGGIKFSAYRVDDLIRLRLKTDGKLNILAGGAEQLLSTQVCGADGSICTWYNLIPRLGNTIINLLRQGDVAGAREHQDLLLRFSTICISQGLRNVKWLISRRGFDVGLPRPPADNPSVEALESVYRQIEAIGMLDWCI